MTRFVVLAEATDSALIFIHYQNSTDIEQERDIDRRERKGVKRRKESLPKLVCVGFVLQ